MLIGFSNGIRGAKRLTAPKALGGSDKDMSCHAARMKQISDVILIVKLAPRRQAASDRPAGVMPPPRLGRELKACASITLFCINCFITTF